MTARPCECRSQSLRCLSSVGQICKWKRPNSWPGRTIKSEADAWKRRSGGRLTISIGIQWNSLCRISASPWPIQFLQVNKDPQVMPIHRQEGFRSTVLDTGASSTGRCNTGGKVARKGWGEEDSENGWYLDLKHRKEWKLTIQYQNGCRKKSQWLGREY